MSLKAILFDLDGTLIDTIDDLSWAAERVLTEWGRGRADGTPVHTRDAYYHFVGNTYNYGAVFRVRGQFLRGFLHSYKRICWRFRLSYR